MESGEDCCKVSSLEHVKLVVFINFQNCGTYKRPIQAGQILTRMGKNS